MAMSDYSLSDIAAVSEGGGMGGMNGGWWILLLFILLGGWNNNGSNAGSVGGNELYPWMENQQNIFNGFSAAEQSAAARQMAMQSQFAECCCDNRLATANLGTTIAAEGAATRTSIDSGLRDVIVSQTASTQRILDKLCDQELAAERRENDQLRQQLNMANLAASQTAQTAAILADNARQTTALEQYLNPAPIPAYTVQNPNCCTSSYGCAA